MAKALEEHERAYALVPSPGVHSAWGLTVNSYTATLIEIGRAGDAEALVERALSEAATIELVPYLGAQLQMSLALAKASLGKVREATVIADQAVRAMAAADAFGVGVIEHHVRRALVALRVGDVLGFDVAARTVERLSVESGNPFFAAKHEFLQRQVRSSGSYRPAPLAQMEIVTRRESHTTIALGLRSELKHSGTAAERAERALGVLLEWSGAESGFLYLCASGRLSLAASSTKLDPPEFLESTMNEWLHCFVSGGPTSRTASPLDPGSAETLAFDVVGIVTLRDGRPLLAGVAALGRSQAGRAIPDSVIEAVGDALIQTGNGIEFALPS
jgi:hypothetical protein